MNDTVRRHFLRQAGVIHRRQAIEAGMSPRQIDRMTRTGEWLTVRRGVYRLHAASPLPETGLHAASLWLGQSALLADEGAAWWWEQVPDPPATWTFITTSHRLAGRGVRLIDAHVAREDRSRHRGVPVLSPAWTALRTAASLERTRAGSGIAFVDRLVQTQRVRHVAMCRALDRHPGCWGSAAMRQLLVRTGDGAHSELERMAVALLRQAGVRGFVLNHGTTLSGGRRVEIDIAFPERRIAIELDGFAYHSSPQAFREDVQRANLLMRDGWTVRRFTYSDLLNDPDAFVESVWELLRG